MKFEDFLMEPTEKHQKRHNLEDEVVKLKEELYGEQTLNKALHWALHGPLLSHPRFSSSFPPQVQVLIEELVVVEDEISKLERTVEELKLSLYKEREQNKEWEIQQQQKRLWQHNLFLCGPESRSVLNGQRCRSQNYDEIRKEINVDDRRFSTSAASDIQSMSSRDEIDEKSRRKTGRSRNRTKEDSIETPNEISEQLVKCLIGIYLDINQVSMDKEGSPIVSKHGGSCMNSNRCMAKSTFSCKAPPYTSSFNYSTSNLDPYNILTTDLDGSVRDVGPYNGFIQITRNSLDIGRFQECLPAIRKLRILMHKLSRVDLTLLRYKQKLAFWINIYNACVMHAFLEHGLPSTQEKLLVLMNKAALNVGGIVLNALAIEHFILRHPSESKHNLPFTFKHTDEKEMLLRHVYGLGYPEPNVTFALCRGCWSSPALRVYTADEVVNELGRARVEYLEASVGVTSKKKISVPKVLQWHMRDFADDMESLLEWIYSQLPRSASLKRLIMESLNAHLKSPINKLVKIQPYQSEFRYLLPM